MGSKDLMAVDAVKTKMNWIPRTKQGTVREETLPKRVYIPWSHTPESKLPSIWQKVLRMVKSWQLSSSLHIEEIEDAKKF